MAKQCRKEKKNICSFLLLGELQTAFSSLGTLDFLSTCLGIDSLRIFLTQGPNPRLLHLLYWQADSLPLRHVVSPRVTILFLKNKTKQTNKKNTPSSCVLTVIVHWVSLSKYLVRMKHCGFQAGHWWRRALGLRGRDHRMILETQRR